MIIHRALVGRGIIFVLLFPVLLSGVAGCQDEPRPTAIEQVPVERIWTVPPFRVERQPGYHQFEGVTWKGSREGGEPSVGVEFALTWKDGLRGSEAYKYPVAAVPNDADYIGAPQPVRAYRVQSARHIIVTDPASWDWSSGSFMRVLSLNGTLEHRTMMAELHDLNQRPAWWPSDGPASVESPEAGQFVPTRNAIVYFFDCGPGLVQVKADGRRSYEHGPFEYIVEDHTGPEPRLVGFRLDGEPGPPPGSLFMAHDGSWAIAFDESTMRAWFLPLHLAWDYLDDADPQPVQDADKQDPDAPGSEPE